MAHGLAVDRLQLYLRFDRPLAPEERDRVRELIRLRGGGRPVAYLVGERAFHALTFRVDPAVLIPRPETEHLVDVAVEALRGAGAPVLADVGVGSGCVAISVLHALPGARAHGTDVSEAALAVAAANAVRLGVGDRLSLALGDLLEPVAATPDWGRLDAVLSNPPYVVRGDPTLAADVEEHEPGAALFVPGADALHYARRIAERALEGLAPGGLLAIEIGAGSAPEGVEALRALGYRDVGTTRDLAGIERVLVARRP